MERIEYWLVKWKSYQYVGSEGFMSIWNKKYIKNNEELSNFISQLLKDDKTVEKLKIIKKSVTKPIICSII